MVESWFTANPRPGLLAHVAGNRDNVEVADSFVRNTVRVVFQPGYSSIVAGAGNAMLALLQNPEKFEEMRDPELLSSGFDELMRYDASVQGTSRIVTESTTIGGVPLKRGDVVVVLFGAANRDPDKFPRPDELTLDRTPNQHMALPALVAVIASAEERVTSHATGQYQGVLAIGRGATNVAGPVALVAVVGAGQFGWAALALVFFAAGLAMPVATRLPVDEGAAPAA
ncbi:cytochrome P450 [Kitasatospora sp. NPDC058190]|uniref:cytochrome P450 n=1 Tax=Kitasatospora sp. NPDC058190 TaxID=3346371 RepID=UPI0036DE3DDC